MQGRESKKHQTWMLVQKTLPPTSLSRFQLVSTMCIVRAHRILIHKYIQVHGEMKCFISDEKRVCKVHAIKVKNKNHQKKRKRKEERKI